VLAEDPLDRHGVGRVLLDQGREPGVEPQEPLSEIEIGLTAYNFEGDELARPAGQTLDDADAAPGQARVDAEHAHESLPQEAGNDTGVRHTIEPAPRPRAATRPQ
jgi:hypothetical protein